MARVRGLHEETRVLVLVAPELAGGAPGGRLLPREGPAGRFPHTPSPVAAQVAAPTREALVHALRKLAAEVAGALELDGELVGGKLGVGREPWGFRDGLVPPTPDEVRRIARIEDGPHAGGTWVLHVLFVQDLEGFSRLARKVQDDVVGRTREGEIVPDAPPGSHAREQYAVSRGHLVRRGFPYRTQGEEGLVFVGAARRPEAFAAALDAMLGSTGPADPLLRWARPVAAALYFAPPAPAGTGGA